MIALQFYNTYCDEPILNRPELQLIVESRLFKQENASWPGFENLGEFISQDEEGNIHLMTTDFVDGDPQSCSAEIILSRNGFQITVNYLCLLPTKKPQWVEVSDNLNITKGSCASSTYGMGATTKRMKMAFQHMRVT